MKLILWEEQLDLWIRLFVVGLPKYILRCSCSRHTHMSDRMEMVVDSGIFVKFPWYLVNASFFLLYIPLFCWINWISVIPEWDEFFLLFIEPPISIWRSWNRVGSIKASCERAGNFRGVELSDWLHVYMLIWLSFLLWSMIVVITIIRAVSWTCCRSLLLDGYCLWQAWTAGTKGRGSNLFQEACNCSWESTGWGGSTYAWNVRSMHGV